MNLDSLNYYKNASYNIFETIIALSDSARNLMTKTGNLLTESEAISFLLDGTIPKYLKDRKFYREYKIDTVFKYAVEICNYIDDPLVETSVLYSIKSSEYKHYITYDYIDGLTECQKSRVRVLVNSIWYTFLQYSLENDL